MKNPNKLGLIDDETLALDRLKYFISGIPGYQVEFAETNPMDGLRLASQKICDILITDIQMENLNGLLISEQMEELGVPVIICSAHEEFALPSINLSVAGYLIKPVNAWGLNKLLEKVSKKLNIQKEATLEKSKDYFLVEDYASFGYTKVAFSSLYHVEQKQNYSLFHAPPHIYKQRSTLQSVEIMLPEWTFVRVQKSFLINITKLQKIFHKEIILDNGMIVPLGDSYKDQLLNTYKLYNRP
ncbi:LytR/AlgR family response regulator transcription factor [Algoriphagus winogradskyi]|uniref:Two component transcriptional regulator, LytTR family n=1 Tax=Algoriphagus winogradskyi TaxID=237017 RepID=A0ABY1PHB2_9BACT|nr:response regulator transcription factor [Algoriphagus winogradskyi]SMP33488.1 two component transcriptional regulator, LytTR family [Algoriphagus winogradskyi]